MQTHRTETRDGIRLAVDIHESAGTPVETLLLIPGLGATRAVMEPLWPHLVADLRVVVFDPRGVGESDFTAPPWDMAMLGDDAADVIRDITGGSPCAVLGASMGGMVAQHLALDHPELVSRLVLAATTPGGPHTVARNRFARDRLLGRGAQTPAEAYRIACTVLYSEAFQQQHPDLIERQVRDRAVHPVRAQAFAAQNQASLAHNVWDRLPEMKPSTLVLHGTEDVVMPLENARRLASRIPGARHRWFEGCGHLFFHEDPEASAAAVRNFLAA